MGHKSDSSSSGHSSPHHHSHHHHHHRRVKSPRDPSVHSLSSSSLSSSTSSSIHERSTPKIAAVIIAAVIVIAGLIGVTVYLVDADRFEKQAEIKIKEVEKEERIYNVPSTSETALDYQTYHDETANFHRMREINNHRPHHQSRPHHQGMARYRHGKDPEGPDMNEANSYEDYYQETSEETTNRQIIVDGQGSDLNDKFTVSKESSIKDMFGDAFFEDPTESIEETEEKESYVNHPRPYGSKINTWVGMQQQASNRQEDQQRRIRPRFNRPATVLANPMGGNLRSDGKQHIVLDTPTEEAISEMKTPDLKSLPPNGSRGGIQVPVHKNQGLPTVDRRPGRPAFHHMGPMRTRVGQQNMRRRQMLLRQQQQAMFQRRMGRPQQPEPVNPIEEAQKLLSNFDSFMALAESEVVVLKDIARNITASGKEINLWEILGAVNNTMKDNPDSAIARLMNRFYNTYLMEESSNSTSSPVKPGYEKSLSSLLFLSFGIFLLNSVNDIIAVRGLSEGRNFGPPEPSSRLLANHSELLELFPAVEEKGSETPAGHSPTVNGYLRLLMNLMNAYNTEGNEEELECIWSLYCHQLNRQASLGGMVSTVARINSVGMRVMLKNVEDKDAIRLMARSLFKWQDIQCNEMFPKCRKNFEQENDTKMDTSNVAN